MTRILIKRGNQEKDTNTVRLPCEDEGIHQGYLLQAREEQRLSATTRSEVNAMKLTLAAFRKISFADVWI